MNMSYGVEDNDASSIELNDDDQYADLREPVYLQSKRDSSAAPSNRKIARKSSNSSKKEPKRKDNMKESKRDLPSKNEEKGKTKNEENGKTGPKAGRKEAKEKRFRWGRDKNGRILCEYFSSTRPLTEEDINAYWYRDEIDEIQRRARRDANKSENTEYHENLLELFKGCRDDNFKNNFHGSNLVVCARKVAESKYRGLEIAVYDSTMLVENDEVVWDVLEQQDSELDRHNPKRLQPKKIASTSKSRTKRAKRLAYALAHGDALAAFDLY